jgi:hypothetical protein
MKYKIFLCREVRQRQVTCCKHTHSNATVVQRQVTCCKHTHSNATVVQRQVTCCKHTHSNATVVQRQVTCCKDTHSNATVVQPCAIKFRTAVRIRSNLVLRQVHDTGSKQRSRSFKVLLRTSDEPRCSCKLFQRSQRGPCLRVRAYCFCGPEALCTTVCCVCARICAVFLPYFSLLFHFLLFILI